jgi:hypothetical protein
MQQLKHKLSEIDQERSQFKTQQQKVEDDVSSITQSMIKMGAVKLLPLPHAPPPCAPARTHGQIQAPREPPN